MIERKYIFYCVIIIILAGCNRSSGVFTELPSGSTGVNFINSNADTDTLNIFDYLYYYNGAGVAVGDINNDGLPDIYLTANQGSNKLYLNQGRFKFKDITDDAGVKGTAAWSTGVTMADVNGDGWLDIYACAVANHRPQAYGTAENSKVFFAGSKNELFINNKNGSFTESAAQYGIDVAGYSTQSAFFDYDKDGDLDMFLLQHSIHQTDSYGDTSQRRKYSSISGCKFFKNEDGGHFVDVTRQTNLISSALGYGLGVAVADFNNDGWEDIYVGNDFHENDYYYLNNGNGTFTESLRNAFGHTSNFSMGNDAADFNNDGNIDLMTLDMLPGDEKILKTSLVDESFDEYENLHQQGYYYQYSKNCLQLNFDNGKHFAETALYSGIAATDWSWGVLGADFNLDGNKDIFISNGIKRRLNNLDFLKFRSAEVFQYNSADERSNDKNLLSHIPEAAWHNYLFINDGNAKFLDESAAYGFNKPTLSNGCAYADLDNDGDLDLVVNNLNEQASILKNNTVENKLKNFIDIRFNGSGKNKFGIGAKVFAFTKNKIQVCQVQSTRGFLSSVEPRVNMGFDTTTLIDSLIIIWPDKKYQTLFNIKTNQHLVFNNVDAKETISNQILFINNFQQKNAAGGFTDISSKVNLQWQHKENLSFNDFSNNPFIPHQLSTLGPALAIADVNGDGLDDIFAGGAKNQAACLFMQNKSGNFIKSNQYNIALDSVCEDIKAVFFDADGDMDMDLYVTSGGGEVFGKSATLKDRLYLNDGKGYFTKQKTLPDLFENKSAVTAADYDNDGDIDIFAGGRADGKNYGKIPESGLLINDGNGNFSNITSSIPGLANAGMISDAVWYDLNDDKYPELIITGEWMPPVIYKNDKGKLSLLVNNALNNLTGLWQSVFIADVNADKLPDIVLGNYGLNSKLAASQKYPLQLFCKDIDQNGNTDQILAIAKNGNYFTFLGKETLEKQLPFIKKEYLSFDKMAGKTIDEIFYNKLKDAKVLNATTLASVVLINKRGLNFQIMQLPDFFQYMPLFSFIQLPDASIMAGGNFYGVMPFEGRYDNDMLPVMRFNKDNMQTTGYSFAKGEVRNMHWINVAGKKIIVIARNNLPLLFLEPR